eukprot:scaffold286661_cov26-Tisochrysis_lutea.AAC.11
MDEDTLTQKKIPTQSARGITSATVVSTHSRTERAENAWPPSVDRRVRQNHRNVRHVPAASSSEIGKHALKTKKLKSPPMHDIGTKTSPKMSM